MSKLRSRTARVVFLVLFASAVLATLWRVVFRPTPPWVQVREERISHWVYGLGTVEAERRYQLRPGVIDRIVKLHVQEGEFVRKDATLLDSEVTKFRAPFSGTITALPFKEGENIFPQVPVITLVDLSSLYLKVSLEQRDVVKVRPGCAVRASLESLRDQPLDGTVRSVYPNDGHFVVRIDTPPLPSGTLPGMTADIAIETSRGNLALIVPSQAISRDGAVVVLKEGKMRRIEVETGSTSGHWVEIMPGAVRKGDQLIIAGKD